VVEGVTARIVRDVATHNGALLEKTSDWYAQDKQGNVWYLGEDTAHYLPNGKIDTSGSWEAGVRDAEPGIIMEAHPRVGDVYQQEYYAGHAEDVAEVLSLDASISVPYGSFDHVLQTKEWSPLEKGNVGNKYYAPGVGEVAEYDVKGGNDFFELVSVTTG
jgi:hypothetical protein